MAIMIERCMIGLQEDATPEAKWLRSLLCVMRDDCELASANPAL